MRTVLLVVLAGVLAASPAASQLNYVACPPTPLGGGANDCATMQVPLDYENPSGAKIDFFIRRYFAGPAPTNLAVWMLNGGPGFSTVDFRAIAPALFAINPNVTLYLADQRGTGLSTPLNCANPPTVGIFDPYNATVVKQFDDCNRDIASKYAATAKFYSTANAARDYIGAINATNPAKVSIYALSYGTNLINTYLILGGRADAVILDGPVAPTRWALENNAEWASTVSQQIQALCGAQSAKCSERIAQTGQIPRFVMDSIIDGTLPCLAKVPWLNQHTAATYTLPFTYNGPTQVLNGPFWWRLYRCTDSDAEQLNFFGALQQANNKAADPSVYSYGLAVVLGASELYTYANNTDMTYAAQVNRTARMLTDAGPQLSVSLARETVPRYNPDPRVFKRYAKPTMPVMILAGTLDPNTPQGLGPWFRDGLGNATLVTVPYAAHGTLEPTALCVGSIAFPFLLSFGAVRPGTACLANITAPDFQGDSQQTKLASRQFFGTTDVWNEDQRPINPVTTTTTRPSGAIRERWSFAHDQPFLFALSAAAIGHVVL
ncbi:Alpha/Beta hydrolase protein [Hyaloraphidium curvatum]|nr:Alpha/Beta hydrolase protein [Hyaloraphidium curvatum]